MEAREIMARRAPSLEERINAMLEERTQPGYLAEHSFALRG